MQVGSPPAPSLVITGVTEDDSCTDGEEARRTIVEQELGEMQRVASVKKFVQEFETHIWQDEDAEKKVKPTQGFVTRVPKRFRTISSSAAQSGEGEGEYEEETMPNADLEGEVSVSETMTSDSRDTLQCSSGARPVDQPLNDATKSGAAEESVQSQDKSDMPVADSSVQTRLGPHVSSAEQSSTGAATTDTKERTVVKLFAQSVECSPSTEQQDSPDAGPPFRKLSRTRIPSFNSLKLTNEHGCSNVNSTSQVPGFSASQGKLSPTATEQLPTLAHSTEQTIEPSRKSAAPGLLEPCQAEDTRWSPGTVKKQTVNYEKLVQQDSSTQSAWPKSFSAQGEEQDKLKILKRANSLNDDSHAICRQEPEPKTVKRTQSLKTGLQTSRDSCEAADKVQESGTDVAAEEGEQDSVAVFKIGEDEIPRRIRKQTLGSA